MSVLPGLGARLALGGLLSFSAMAVRADDLLVMPYSCKTVRGQPVLTPSADEGHAIIGPREQRHFTACSPVNPSRCRHWMVHRFDLDCGGTRVPWVAVVAAAAGGRAWLEGDRLKVRMGPWWSYSPGVDPRHASPVASMEMPTGFAPMLGIDGIFVAGGAPKQSAKPPASVVPPPAPPTARSEVPLAPRPPPPPPSVTTDRVTPRPAPAREAGLSPQTPPPEEAAAPGTPANPRIINNTRPAPEKAVPEAPAATVVPKATEAAPKGQDEAISVSLLNAMPSGSATTAALAGIGLGVLAVFALMRWREHGRLAETASRDFAAVSLEGSVVRGKSPAPHRPARVAGRQLTRVAPPASPLAQGPSAGAAPSSWGTAMPTTREEALRVLGMGVTPGASEIAIKKIVDGLRLSWHPDYANSPADRDIRELRFKQINAAWEIVCGKTG